jgi:hypothetical protein
VVGKRSFGLSATNARYSLTSSIGARSVFFTCIVSVRIGETKALFAATYPEGYVTEYSSRHAKYLSTFGHLLRKSPTACLSDERR